MQNWITKAVLGVATLSALALTSCKKDEVQATLTPSNSPTLSSSTNSVVLTQANAANTAVTFTWTPIASFTWTNVDHPYTPSVTYAIQVDKKGNNFANPATIDAGTTSPSRITVADLDAALLNLGVATGTPLDYEVRIRALYAANAPLYSATVPLNATAYAYCPQPAKAWSIIGPAGVDWSTDVTMLYDCTTGYYSYSGPMQVGDYKFRYNKDWTANLGGTSSTGGPLTQDGSNLTISVAKNYTIVLKPAALDASGKVTAGSTYTIQ